MIIGIKRSAGFLGVFLSICSIIGVTSFHAFAQQAKSADAEDVKVDPATVPIIEGALRYLADQQLPDGSWSGDKANADIKFPVAMTSYALIAFLANGNLPDAGPYAKQVTKGLQFLLDSSESDGMFREKPRQYYMYSHGIATMVLAEIYGETQDPIIRRKLERALMIIEHSQNPEGGWRYQPGSKDADLSVTVPQTVALLGAKRAGIIVPQVTIDKAIAYIRSLQVNVGNPKYIGFGYQAPVGPGLSRTAAAIYAIQISGSYDDPLVVKGSSFVADRGIPDYLTYGNYYAAVSLYLVGGDKWRQYYQKFSKYLLKNAQTNGTMSHWDSSLDSQAKNVGSNWCTAVFTTILSMPYGYLPLYQR